MTFPFIIKYVFFTLCCINQPFKLGSWSKGLISETTDQNGGFSRWLQSYHVLLV